MKAVSRNSSRESSLSAYPVPINPDEKNSKNSQEQALLAVGVAERVESESDGGGPRRGKKRPKLVKEERE